jgi:hypothetical protein
VNANNCIKGRFAVYAGAGVYLSHVSLDRESGDKLIVISTVDRALTLGRAAAVRLCHEVRAGGVGAWVTLHPSGAAS